MRIQAICLLLLLFAGTAFGAPVVESRNVIAQDRKGETVVWVLEDSPEGRQPVMHAADWKSYRLENPRQ